MATLNVKNFPEMLYRKLRSRAKRHRRSVANEVTVLLERAVESEGRHSLLELRGLGKEAWKGIDPVRFLASERRSWD